MPCRARWRFPVGEPVILQAGQFDAGERLQNLQRFGSLDGEQRVARTGVHGDRIACRLDLLGNPLVVLGDVRRVDHEQKMRRRGQ